METEVLSRVPFWAIARGQAIVEGSIKLANRPLGGADNRTGAYDLRWRGSYAYSVDHGPTLHEDFEARMKDDTFCVARVNIIAQQCQVPPDSEESANFVYEAELAKRKAAEDAEARLEAKHGSATDAQRKMVIDALVADMVYWNQATLDRSSLRNFYTHADRDFPLMVHAEFVVSAPGNVHLANSIDAAIENGVVRCIRITGPSGDGYCDPPRTAKYVEGQKRMFQGLDDSPNKSSCSPDSLDDNGKPIAGSGCAGHDVH